MKKKKPNNPYNIPSTSKNASNTDDIDFIDPVASKDQLEEKDPFFKQMGDDRNAKLIEQKIDDDEPIGSINGEYKHDDENTDENPPKEAILHEVRTKLK
ncbi:hypothetical protein A3G67_02225 [Candidatus Roizmanbacteria bacterium RIFCSPLOWO2_12_FULL_40_12]|uniref:Uncharacterized protein n=1 Tax=Candidatus Roizmanbacteria bacterium RIFCSPLOWO2_01_FULL_40_42 TaxID=1802066 RepID=A0A1F7J3R2_9BACT|nr:MAG: hypothetical protein A2779_01430 [Candidatus Roizmanbacteria bacterium RIFCSPHIGHO2_01_FULL_40_98]OGK29021.1 MAG: hypothetical protein A3C31_02070 [Candidatus Roizmanbacteria bacterium RIFCSPHIGHO2_02_FULL_40_53]OGK29982.1 MAG: hypothetical protein A2W49_00140 [Candidatus Roizmanbacteria bacterium RIFCSPHIGHO2_12_41_18]OGK37309.1 MAG: hypothetical protein A3E69_04370 [Candidatus Roizmanbacteria bacterium RIFCSPHIGHO2_12_FULL_40_130]OGK50251.1 MAG: hypothetical protein A3B50_00525 [Candi